MPIQAFIDESGGKGQGPVFLFAGLMGEAEEWAVFSHDWKLCLQEAPRISRFKMHEAAGLTGQFAHWSIAARDKKLEALASVLNRPCFRAIHCTIPDLDAYLGAMGGWVVKPMSDPYFTPFQIILMGVCFDLLERGHNEQCEVIFDEHLIFGPRARLWYPVIKSAIDPAEVHVFPTEPIFKNDENTMPLQAADLLAWLFRRETSGMEHTFHWIPAALSSVEMSPWSDFLTGERMRKIVAQSKDVAATLTEKMIKEYRRLLYPDEEED